MVEDTFTTYFLKLSDLRILKFIFKEVWFFPTVSVFGFSCYVYIRICLKIEHALAILRAFGPRIPTMFDLSVRKRYQDAVWHQAYKLTSNKLDDFRSLRIKHFYVLSSKRKCIRIFNSIIKRNCLFFRNPSQL